MRIRLSLLVVAAMLVMGGPAYAAGGSALNSAYPSTPHNVAGSVASPPKQPPHVATPSSVVVSPANTQGSGNLPFTGTNLGLFAGAAIVLVALGFGFRRLGRR